MESCSKLDSLWQTLCLHLMVLGVFIPEKVPDGSADKLSEVVEPALVCVAPEEEATALEAALKG